MYNGYLLLKFILFMTLVYAVTTNSLLKQLLQMSWKFTVIFLYLKY